MMFVLRLAIGRKNGSPIAESQQIGIWEMDKADSPIRVLIAHGQRPICRRLRMALEGTCGVRVTGEASNGRSASILAGHDRPDVLLLDPWLPLLFEIEDEIGRGSRNAGRATVAIVSGMTRQHVLDALRVGARGITLDTAGADELLASIRTVISECYYLPNLAIAVLVEALLESVYPADREGHAKQYRLTPRETAIVEKIAAGLSNRMVGQEFSISERTVKQHLTNIFGKIGVSNRTALALFAVNHRLAAAGPLVAPGAECSDDES